MLRLATFLLILGLATSAPAQDDLANVYDLTARFDPATGEIAVEGSMTIVADDVIESVELLLNAGVRIRSFTYGDGAAPIIERDVEIAGQALPKTQRLRLPLEAPLARGERLHMTFAYDGRITTEDIEIGRGVVSPGWTEMTLEALWYPVFLAEPQVRSVVLLETPGNYDVVGPGVAEKMEDGRWRLDPGGPVAGRITFAQSDSWIAERRPLNDQLSAVLYSVEPEPAAADILGAVGEAYSFYQGLFGTPSTDKSTITLLYPNRDPGLVWPNQAYSTGGDFIVMNLSDLRVQLDTLNHEMAHLWWSAGRPGTPDEFMSESVSEYLALRRGQQAWGDAWLMERRAAMDAASGRIDASLLDIDGFGGHRQSLMYERGPAVLWALHDDVGAEAMDALLAAAYAARIDRLEDFIALVEERLGRNRAEALRADL